MRLTSACLVLALLCGAGKLDAEAETVLPHTHADIYWHGVASTGETAADYSKGDLHLTMHWLPEVSELMARIKEL